MKYDLDLFVRHLSGMIPYATVSNVDTNKMDFSAFFGLHKYMEETWPLVHKTMTKELIGKAGLLYHWKGNGKSDKLPLMLIAHQDVVPEGEHELWKYPPYSGEVAEGFIWGRGTTDSKVNIEAYMDALELLIASGFEPEYDLYFAFGYNEEIMCGPEPAAQLIANTLRERGVQIGCLLDECGGLMRASDGTLYAGIYVSEKGYADFQFTKEALGGHSATPVPHSALGNIARIVCLLEDNPMEPKLTEVVRRQLEDSSSFMDDKTLSELCKDVRNNWDKLLPILTSNPRYNAMIRTTTAVTMAKGSEQANVMPERAWIIVNNRMLPGETIDTLWEHYHKIVPDDIKITLLKGTNPPPQQSVDSYGYKLIENVIKQQYPGIKLIPQLLSGGTDSRYYCDICPTDSIYRFTGLAWEPSWNSHMVNEKIPCAGLDRNVEFYVKLLTQYGK